MAALRLLLLLVVLGVALVAVVARPDAAPARLTASSLPPEVPALDARTRPLLAQARAIMRRPDSTWRRAVALRDLVHGHVLGTCGTVADAFWRLALNVGMPLRRVQLSANGRNAFDTHITTEAWLAEWGRWAVVDAYFNGWWSDTRFAGRDRPIGVAAVHAAARAGELGRLRWHDDGLPFGLSARRSYVDPSAFYWIAYYAMYVGAHDWASYVVSDPSDVLSDGTYRTSSALVAAPPSRLLPVTAVPVTTPSQAVRSTPTDPPRYALRLRSRRRVTVAGTAGSWRYPRARSTFVIVRGARGRWSLDVHGKRFPLDEVRGVHLSPISPYAGPARLTVRGAPRAASYTVEVWSARTMPARMAAPPR